LRRLKPIILAATLGAVYLASDNSTANQNQQTKR